MFYKSKKLKQHIAIVLLSVCFVGVYYLFLRAAATPAVRFTADTNVILTGLSGADLQIGTNSECVGVDISGTNLTVYDITDGSTFILKTPDHNKALSIYPTGGTADLILDSNNISANEIIQWRLTSTGNTDIKYIIGVANANTKYDINIDNKYFSSYVSDNNSEVSFKYRGSGQRVFAIAESPDSPGGGLPPSSGYPPSQPTPTPENPEGEFKIIIEPTDEATTTDITGEIIIVKETREREIILKLFAGDNVDRMIISEDPEFKDVGQEPFQETKLWTLSEGEGKKTIYVKFFTKYGVPSKTISADIILLSPITELAPEVIPPIATTTAATTTETVKPDTIKPWTDKIAEKKKAQKLVITDPRIYFGWSQTVIAEISEGIIEGLKNTIINARNLFNGLALSIYGELAENIVDSITHKALWTKDIAVRAFDITIYKLNNLLPDFIENGYERMFKWVKAELWEFLINKKV